MFTRYLSPIFASSKILPLSGVNHQFFARCRASHRTLRAANQLSLLDAVTKDKGKGNADTPVPEIHKIEAKDRLVRDAGPKKAEERANKAKKVE